MAYYKPQSPLKNGNDFIYPLTTVDQVLFGNGRLGNSDGTINITPSSIGAATVSHTHGYLPLTGGSMTGPVTFANNTWNPVGDDAAIGDHNYAGAVCFKSLNHNETSLVLYNPAETATGVIRLDGSNNLILYADGGIVYSAGTVGIGQGKMLYFDSVTGGVGPRWQFASSDGQVFQLVAGSNDSSNAANGYWVDMQCHGTSSCSSAIYATRWIQGAEQGRFCLLDQYNNTWKTNGAFYMQNNSAIHLQWNNNGTQTSGLVLWADGEGGNIEFHAPNGNYFQMDAYNGNWRMYGVSNGAYCGEITVTPYGQLYGAVWNDYAEYRAQNEPLIAGHITYCDDDGKLKYTTERLQKFEGVVSDTFGFSIGETDECKTPLAVSGRALVYCDPEDHFHSGDCVCAGPDGKAYRMTREEIAMYPDRIVGVVSEIPTYERWGTGDVEVNGRIWIKVK